MKKIDSFINLYPLSKTLQFQLVPQGKTLENFQRNVALLDADKKRAELYKKVKKYIDEYHKEFIDQALSKLNGLDVSGYASLYYKTDKTDADKKALQVEAEKLRKKILDGLKAHPDYKKLFEKEMIKELLPKFLKDATEREEAEFFETFTTYFRGFHENRKNLYTAEEQSTAIPYRCINDNLPKFLDNVKIFRKIEAVLPNEIEELARAHGTTAAGVAAWFSADNFSFVITQKGISAYNELIGGRTEEGKEKIQGLNEYINLYNQTCEKSEKLPKFTQLFKQILSDRIAFSYIPEKFSSDDELLKTVRAFYDEIHENSLKKIKDIFSDFTAYERGGIYVENGAPLTNLSQKLSGNWRAFKDDWESRYDASESGKKPKNMEKYLENREKVWKNTAAFSAAELEDFFGLGKVTEYYQNAVKERLEEVVSSRAAADGILQGDYAKTGKRLAKNDDDIALIKNLLDALKTLERTLQDFSTDASLNGKNERFYADLTEPLDRLSVLDRLYDQTRNYITQKPYSKDKIKLNFENPQFMVGWDKNKETDCQAALLRNGGNYYLAVMDRTAKKTFARYPSEANNGWEKIDYKLLPGPNKMLPKVFFAKSNVEYFAPSSEILRIYENGTFKKGAAFSLEDCQKLIAFYQQSIAKHPDWLKFGFAFKRPTEYADIAEFYKEVEKQGYVLSFLPISEAYIREKVDAGELYLFQIYNKDFSPYSKGKPNLHTLYFKALFDERNLKDVVYKLNGESEMFYRFASIQPEERIVHEKNRPIKNKNPYTVKNKPTSVFAYDLVKDKRFTKDQFSLHVPITLNFSSRGDERINTDVRKALKTSGGNYVIGIDRGERHLIYVTVIDEKGSIVEQFSGNVISGEYDGKRVETDYHALLEKKEAERDAARRAWTTVEKIKDLKEGYVSQLVHKICALVIKYDAVIAMENLNLGFKQGRSKVEKSVYQKFEKMLIDKLNYLVDKNAAAEENGGILRAYQLTEKFESFRKMGTQNGFIFYVPPYLTSKIDPTTGFADLLKPKYKNEADSKAFIEKFDSVVFDETEKTFAFSFNYQNFQKSNADAQGKWTVYANGERIETYRGANGVFEDRVVLLFKAWTALFESVGIDWRNGNLKTAILSQSGKAFFESFMRLLRLTLQMRNSKTRSQEDYLLSPVKNAAGEFYDSRNYGATSALPANADANGAYNIARKALWAIERIKQTDETELSSVSLAISNKEWLAYAQKQ